MQTTSRNAKDWVTIRNSRGTIVDVRLRHPFVSMFAWREREFVQIELEERVAFWQETERVASISPTMYVSLMGVRKAYQHG